MTSFSSAVEASIRGSSARTLLKATTRDLHERVDARFSMSGDSTRDGYRNMLLAHARILPPLEEKLARSLHVRSIPHMDSRWRSSHLREDLRALNCEVPTPMNMSFDDAAPSVAGIMYVLEGSRIGSGFLLKQVLRNTQEMPVAFLSHGREQKLWPSFVAWLDAEPWTEDDRLRMRESARSIFSAYLEAAERTSTENQ
ncbi:biliverdin-producing heme oxygenase [Oricola cellulosilytica]|nr:biliverdin-producing heme oxygenase [Oricola cellulosilytica]